MAKKKAPQARKATLNVSIGVEGLESVATHAANSRAYLEQCPVRGDEAAKLASCITWLAAVEESTRTQIDALMGGVRKGAK
jgi:hypothetical protein